MPDDNNNDLAAAVAAALGGTSSQPSQPTEQAPADLATTIATAVATAMQSQQQAQQPQQQQASLSDLIQQLATQPRPINQPNGSPAPLGQGIEARRSHRGLIDVFSLTDDEVNALGDHGVRREFERTLAHGRRASGAPPLPKALRDRGGR